MKRKSISLLVLAAIGLVASACGGTSSVTNSTSSNGSSETSSATSSATSNGSSITTSETTSSATSSVDPVVEYTVSLPNSSDYTITMDHEDGKYEKGEVVTLTITVTNENKVLKEVKAENLEVTISTEGNVTTAKFTMGESNVEVTVALEALTFALNETSVLGSQASSQVESVTYNVTDATKVEVDSDVTVKVTFTSALSPTNIKSYVLYVEGVGYQVDVDLATKTDNENYEEYTGGLVTFKMPKKATTPALTAVTNLSAAPEGTKGIKMVSEPNEYVVVTGYVSNMALTNVYITAYVKAGYRVDAWQYSDDNGESWEDLSGYMYYNSYNDTWTGTLYNGSVESENVIFRVTGEYVGVQTINYTNLDAVKITNGSAPTEVTPGQIVNIYYNANNDYHITGPATITGVPAEDIEVNNTSSISFVMPNNAVTITFNVDENGAIIVADNDKISSVLVGTSSWSAPTESLTSGTPGSVYYAFVTAADGYKVVSGHVNGGEAIAINSTYFGDYLQFTMPEDGSDVTLTFDVSEIYDITVAEGIVGGSISTNKTTAGEGENVTFTVTPTNAFYTLTEVKDNNHPDLEITFTKASYGNYYNCSFTMPKGDVELTAVFNKEDGQVITLDTGDHEEAISGLSIRGNSSNTLLGQDYNTGTYVTTGEFVNGEQISLSLSVKTESGFEATLYVVKGENEEALTPVNTNISYGILYYSYNNFTLTDDVTGFKITYAPRSQATVNVTAEGIDDITYAVNGGEALTLEQLNSSLYVNDQVTIDLPDEGIFNVEITDAEGETIATETDYYDDSIVKFTVTTSEVNVVITEAVTYQLTINDTVGAAYSSIRVSDANYNYYYSGDHIKENTSLNLYVYFYGTYGSGADTATLTFTIGDDVEIHTLNAGEFVDLDFEMTADVTIDFSYAE